MRNAALCICLLLFLQEGCKKSNPNQSNSNASGSELSTAEGNPSSLSETTVGGVTLKPLALLDGKLELLMPEDFEPMSEELIRIKYPNANRPKIVFTSQDTKVNIAANHTDDRVVPSQLFQLQQQLDSSLRTAYPSAKWNFNGKSHLAGREWIRLDLVTPAADTNIRNIMLATSAENRMLMVTMNITEDLDAEWAAVAEAIIASISYRD